MLRTIAAAGLVIAAGAATVSGAGAANAAPNYDLCTESQYVTSLFTDLFEHTPPVDRAGAAARAQTFAASAPAEIELDSLIEAYAETAVLNGAPSDLVLRTDPVFQAWGDVMDWHTDHCL
ncbi:hypothetical protein [Nocardia arthritidis]|uniref:Hemophore-related protein n=1 Tax=Nocardia arthritidis TaxID=228602 RepID=A0A6G9YPG1_9NOCA|nr:hypothetical protein [Nocardia arthritidis]QIS15078.1 hypothetical protein F5544_36245 [Nocardia arthritidis]